jgi:hypothetical protein
MMTMLFGFLGRYKHVPPTGALYTTYTYHVELQECTCCEPCFSFLTGEVAGFDPSGAAALRLCGGLHIVRLAGLSPGTRVDCALLHSKLTTA